MGLAGQTAAAERSVAPLLLADLGTRSHVNCSTTRHRRAGGAARAVPAGRGVFRPFVITTSGAAAWIRPPRRTWPWIWREQQGPLRILHTTSLLQLHRTAAATATRQQAAGACPKR